MIDFSLMVGWLVDSFVLIGFVIGGDGAATKAARVDDTFLIEKLLILVVLVAGVGSIVLINWVGFSFESSSFLCVETSIDMSDNWGETGWIVGLFITGLVVSAVVVVEDFFDFDDFLTFVVLFEAVFCCCGECERFVDRFSDLDDEDDFLCFFFDIFVSNWFKFLLNSNKITN